MSVLRVISSTAAALAAVQGALLAYPGDIVPQYVLLGVNLAFIFLSVLAANLSVGEPE